MFSEISSNTMRTYFVFRKLELVRQMFPTLIRYYVLEKIAEKYFHQLKYHENLLKAPASLLEALESHYHSLEKGKVPVTSSK